MIKEAIGTADTIEAAKEQACQMLAADDSFEIEFEVLQMPEKKKLGLFGGSPAKVKAFIRITPMIAAEEYLRSVLSNMGVTDVNIVTEKTEDGASFVIEGEDVGAVIGRRGETLDALQYLCGLVANHVDGNYFRVTIDAGEYRVKREKTLENLGRKHGILAAKKGIRHTFEPMNPYERRLIHTAVQNIDGAISWSEGENQDRHVVIGPDPAKRNFRRNNNNRGGKFQNNGNRPHRDYKAPRENAVKAEPKAVDGFSDKPVSLYQKIDFKSTEE